jgi:hypothetical protein
VSFCCGRGGTDSFEAAAEFVLYPLQEVCHCADIEVRDQRNPSAGVAIGLSFNDRSDSETLIATKSDLAINSGPPTLATAVLKDDAPTDIFCREPVLSGSAM